jgi:hypothetical protein
MAFKTYHRDDRVPFNRRKKKKEWEKKKIMLATEAERFVAASGVQLAQSDRGQFHYKRAAFSSQLKSKVDSILTKSVSLRITLNIDGAPIDSKSPPLVFSLSSHRHFNMSSV